LKSPKLINKVNEWGAIMIQSMWFKFACARFRKERTVL
ncbi:hypothetical protein MQM_01653, partial [Staphylococcus aureus subsp. aureus VRS7]